MFSSVGAYVAQEDGLMAQLTPRETFQFACRIRLGMPESEVETRVNQTIERLDLQECQDQLVGGWM